MNRWFSFSKTLGCSLHCHLIVSHARTYCVHTQWLKRYIVSPCGVLHHHVVYCITMWCIAWLVMYSTYDPMVHSGRNNVWSSVNFLTFIKIDRTLFHVISTHDRSRLHGCATTLFTTYTRWKAGLSSSVPCCWVKLFYTFLISCGRFTDC